MNIARQLARRLSPFFILVLLVTVGCSDDGGGDGDSPQPDMTPDPNPAPNNEPNPDPNPVPNPDMNPDMNPAPNPDPNPDMPDDVALCQATCTEVAACPGLVELCSEEILAQVEAGCQQGCAEDEDARAQILAAVGLPCEVVEPLAIDGFGLEELCAEGECVDSTDCEPPGDFCDGNTAVTYDGNGDCVEGACDFDGVEARTDCEEQQLGCSDGACEGPVPVDDSIYAIQNVEDPDHPGTEVEVTVLGVSVSVNQDGFMWVQEPEGGPFSGVFIEEAEIDISGVNPGDIVDLSGITTEGEGGVEGLTAIVLTSLEVVGSGEVPTPELVPVSEFVADAERWESVLVRLEDLVVTNANPDSEGNRDFGEFEVDGTLRVDDLLFLIEPDTPIEATFEALSGVVNFSFGNFKLLPRSEGDVEGYEFDLCAGVECEQPGPGCDGNDIVLFSGDGTCVEETGECDFTDVTLRDPCGDGEICLDTGFDVTCVEDDGGRLFISEVMYNPDGGDGEHEWVEIFNGTTAGIQLDGLSIGRGGGSYAGVLDLTGFIASGGCIVVGGPTSDDNNANPSFDQAEDFNPDLQNGGGQADAVAIFPVEAANINSDTIPIDAVIYGSDNNDNGLIDETGDVGAVDVGDAGSGNTIERVDRNNWRVQENPTPGDCDLLILD